MATSSKSSGPRDGVDPSTVADLRRRLPGLTLRDEHRLRRRLDAQRSKGGNGSGGYDRLRSDVERAEQRVAARRAAVPALRYPEELPVSQRREDLLEAIANHQVVVVAGETGSGK
ncbi:MAG: ATP-dependent helicase HrpA, partial [Pseudonocardiales bacterium]|nr:ATP-dependent helicase HrpA [Pseudonocardiales bacterium]